MELAPGLDASTSGGVIVTAIAAVFTIGYAANILTKTKTGLYERSSCQPRTAAGQTDRVAAPAVLTAC